MAPTLGLMFDTSIALTRIILRVCWTNFPNSTWCARTSAARCRIWSAAWIIRRKY